MAFDFSKPANMADPKANEQKLKIEPVKTEVSEQKLTIEPVKTEYVLQSVKIVRSEKS